MSFDDEQRDDTHDDCRREIKRLEESEELAWGLIANAYGGDWDLAPTVWKAAAERWRDQALLSGGSSEIE